MFCRFCGCDLDDTYNFCDKCGKPINFSDDMLTNQYNNEDNICIKDISQYSKEKKTSYIKYGIIGVLICAVCCGIITALDKPNSEINSTLSNLDSQDKIQEENAKDKSTLNIKDTHMVSSSNSAQLPEASEHELYSAAISSMNHQEFVNALELFELIEEDGYNVDDEREECIKLFQDFAYNQADGYYQTLRYQEALELFECIPDYKDSKEKAELCRNQLDVKLTITPDDAIYYFADTLKVLQDKFGEPDYDPNVHPHASSIGGSCTTNSYQYGSLFFIFVDYNYSLESRVVSIEATEGGELCKGIKVGMTFKELSKYIEFTDGAPIEYLINPAFWASGYMEINGYECIIDVFFPLDADINTPSNKIEIYTKDGLCDDEYNIQYNSIQPSSQDTIEYGIVNLEDGGSYLNVRSGAGREYDIIGKLKYDEEVCIIGDVTGWYIIQYNSSETGFVSKDYIKIIN